MTTFNASFGTPLNGNLVDNATDTYKVSATSGGKLSVSFTHPHGPGTGGQEITLKVMDFFGNVIFQKEVTGNVAFDTTVPSAGDYYLNVSDTHFSNVTPAAYGLLATLANAPGVTYDGGANNTTATAISSPLANQLAGSVASQDTDVFKVKATSGGVLTLNFAHPNGPGTTGAAIEIEVLDADGKVVITELVKGNKVFSTTVPSAGDYYLKLKDGSWYSTDDGGIYTLTPSLATTAATVYDGAANNATATAIPAAMGATIKGSLNAQDTDVFKVSANAGGVLTVNFEHPNGAGTAGAGIKIDLLDAAGNIVASRVAEGNSVFSTTVTGAGDYYLKLSDDDWYGSGDGGIYAITTTLATKAANTYDGAVNNTTATALPSAMAATMTGSLNGQDTDVFKVHADSGGVLALDFVHPAGAGTAGVPIDITLLDAVGNIVTTRTLQGNAVINTTVSEAGDYYLKLADGAWYSTGDGGIYAVTPSLRNLPGAVYDGAGNNTAATALNAGMSTLMVGTVGAQDNDYFKVSASAAGTLSVNFNHPAGVGTAGMNIDVSIIDSSGKVIVAKTERGSDLFTASLPSGGDYYVKLADSDWYSGGDSGVYSLMTALSATGSAGLRGTGAADVFVAGAGNDVIDGAAGRDRVSYGGNSADYKIAVTPAGVSVVDKAGAGGADTLFNVERLQFADKMVAVDVEGVAAQAYRVYQAAFDRVPDAGGLGYWIAQMEAGASLDTVASSFIGSGEFQAMYGSNPGNREMVAKFYTNVLHRAPDQGGLDFWVGALDSGAVNGATVLASFSESAENVVQLTGVIAQGIGYVPYGA
ncbi:MAG: DUF4214 domain-containing protein [Telluria sp.]